MYIAAKSNHDFAITEFHNARRRAMLKTVIRRIKGQPVKLLPFDELIKHINSDDNIDLGLHYIPLEAIVGSVGRYNEFSRDFLPVKGSIQRRWAEVRSIYPNLGDMPPINVYQIREAYFVQDGNHRVSIARYVGATEIRAFITDVCTAIEITPETDINCFRMLLPKQEAPF